MDFQDILNERVDIKVLLDSLDFTDETIGHAALDQGKLFSRVAQYYIQAMRNRICAETALDARKADRGHFFRQRDSERRQASKTAASQKQMTEGRLSELIKLSPSVKKLQDEYDRWVVVEEWAKQMIEAYRQRAQMIKAVAGILGEEAVSDLRIFKENRAKERLRKTRATLAKKYPGEDVDDV